MPMVRGKTARWGRPSREAAAPHDRRLGGDDMMERGLGAARRWVRMFLREEGATAVEYALMLALIAVVIVVAVTVLGQETSSTYADPGLSTALGS